MSIVCITLKILAIITFAFALALAVLAIQERIRLKQNPPRHLKTQPTLTVKEAIQK